MHPLGSIVGLPQWLQICQTPSLPNNNRRLKMGQRNDMINLNLSRAKLFPGHASSKFFIEVHYKLAHGETKLLFYPWCKRGVMVDIPSHCPSEVCLFHRPPQ